MSNPGFCGFVAAALATGFMAGIAFAAPSHERIATYADVQVAQIDDLGKPFDLKANVYVPSRGGARSHPLVIYLHGKGGTYVATKDPIAQRVFELLDRGIAVATIDYRPSGRLPGMVHDGKAYVRYFRANAGKYQIDPNRIALWGVSRGAGIASIMATAGNVPTLEGDVGGNRDQSSLVQAAVIYFPISDIFLNSDKKIEELVPQYFGATVAEATAAVEAYKAKDPSSSAWKTVQAAELVNPLNYIRKDSPPALITIGGNDVSNPLVNSTALYAKYIEKGAEAYIYSYSLGTHGRVGPDIEAASTEWLAKRLLAGQPATSAK